MQILVVECGYGNIVCDSFKARVNADRHFMVVHQISLLLILMYVSVKFEFNGLNKEAITLLKP